jgi:hypothetical protein
MIPVQVPRDRDRLSVRLERALHEELKAYSAFIGGSSKDHIISYALKRVFRRDKEFRAWLETHTDLTIVNAASNGHDGLLCPEDDTDAATTATHSTRAHR